MTYNSSYKKRKKSGQKAEDLAFEFYNNMEGCHIIPFGIESILGSKTAIITELFYHCVPNKLKSMPDFILFWQKKGYKKKMWFIEVKLSSFDFLRLKLLDIETYKYWNETFNESKLLFYIQYANKNNFKQVTFDKLLELITANNYEIKKYPDNNKQYIEIPYKDF
tara:strand:- start:7398 stop:7892 length:495 start_codon:yes stop_codon:yes gene_type:complete